MYYALYLKCAILIANVSGMCHIGYFLFSFLDTVRS